MREHIDCHSFIEFAVINDQSGKIGVIIENITIADFVIELADLFSSVVILEIVDQ